MPNGKKGSIEEIEFKAEFIEAVCGLADVELIRKANFKFAIDSMYGSGRGVLPQIFDDHDIQHIAIRQELNPLFPGINPEPIEPHIALLQETVTKHGCHAGFATDGDADRIGAVAEDGSFVDSHKIFSVLLRWLLVRKKWPGDVVRAFNTTLMLDRIAAKYGRKLPECPSGIKFILDASSNGNGAEPWILFRASGTEPLLRVYAEAASPELVEEILSSAEAFVSGQ